MARALKACPTVGCPNLVAHAGRCPDCTTRAEHTRGTAHQRGYGQPHRTRFRPAVLHRDPLCTCTTTEHGHAAPCLAQSTVADHWPHSRRELIRLRLNANDPQHGRGLCKPCHDKHTAQTQPGGWHTK